MVLKRVVDDTPRPVAEIAPDVPRWLCDLISRLHEKDPARRFQTAAEVADLFNRLLAHLRQPSLVPLPQLAKAGGQAARHRMLLGDMAAAVLAVVGAVLTYGPSRHTTGPAPITSGATDDEAAPASRPAATARAEEPSSNHVLQERADVHAALIDFAEPDRRFGGEAYANPLRRAEQSNAFLVRFNLEKLALPPKARIAEATVSFYVWDPSSSGHTKVCVFPLLTDWDQETVTWRQPAMGRSWRDAAGFAFGADTGPAGASVVVSPEQGSDTAEPPLEYQLDA